MKYLPIERLETMETEDELTNWENIKGMYPRKQRRNHAHLENRKANSNKKSGVSMGGSVAPEHDPD